MLYLNADHIQAVGIEWKRLTGVIDNAVTALKLADYAQPIKPYLRYGDNKNRIIAMPAYIGGDRPWAGIKWIASFPDNIRHGQPRAHSVTILNESKTGVAICAINTAVLSAIRTAAVSGIMIKRFIEARSLRNLTVGIVGFGPIGRMHIKMVSHLIGKHLSDIVIFDLIPIDLADIDEDIRSKVKLVKCWEDCYLDADIFITCTVSDKRYIDKAPKKPSLHLNISLRDYEIQSMQHMDTIIVDDWDEVCRQNTDIEVMHKQTGLQKEDTLSIADITGDKENIMAGEGAIMFNPMGMAVFDIAIAGFYYLEASRNNIGINLPD